MSAPRYIYPPWGLRTVGGVPTPAPEQWWLLGTLWESQQFWTTEQAAWWWWHIESLTFNVHAFSDLDGTSKAEVTPVIDLAMPGDTKARMLAMSIGWSSTGATEDSAGDFEVSVDVRPAWIRTAFARHRTVSTWHPINGPDRWSYGGSVSSHGVEFETGVSFSMGVSLGPAIPLTSNIDVAVWSIPVTVDGTGISSPYTYTLPAFARLTRFEEAEVPEATGEFTSAASGHVTSVASYMGRSGTMHFACTATAKFRAAT